MINRTPTIIFLAILAMIGACTPAPIQETLLFGYRDGKKQMRYETSIVAEKLEDGERGYQLKTHINFSLGVKETMESIRTAWLRGDFSVDHVEVTRTYNGKLITSKVYWEGESLVIKKKEGDAPEIVNKLAVSGIIFSDLHPLLYSNDLKKPGDEKIYQVLHESKLAIRKLTIKYVGNPVMDINGERTATMHFQLEKISELGSFEDYYLDPKTREPVKIDAGVAQFLPPKK